MLPDKNGIHEKTVKKVDGSYDVVIGRFLYASHTLLFFFFKKKNQLEKINRIGIGGNKAENQVDSSNAL